MDTPIRSITARCIDVIDQLPLPRPFDMDHFLDRLSDRRGKLITLVPAPSGTRVPCGGGLVVITRTVDYICYAADTSPLHRLHIVLHEIGHLEFDHRGYRMSRSAHDAPSPPPHETDGPGVGESGETAWQRFIQQLLPNLEPSAIRRLLGRTVFVGDDEFEAELFATLAGDRIIRMIAAPQVSAPRDVNVVRLRSLFGAAPPCGHRCG